MMKEYIEREAFKKKMRYIANTYGLSKVIIEKLYSAMANSTAADVVEVVRCKDCFYNANASCDLSQYVDPDYRPNYFCADGMRKEERK